MEKNSQISNSYMFYKKYECIQCLLADLYSTLTLHVFRNLRTVSMVLGSEKGEIHRMLIDELTEYPVLSLSSGG
jgi:hypothetical protein